MTLPIPKLDDRKFQDFVDEAKKRIPHYCKEWTDHNVSDPGVTMIELFAWMADVMLYRLNQVPDLHYIKMMEMLGVRLTEPTPAHADVTFWLSKPQDIQLTIPAGTEVASTQTETEPSIIFTTDSDFTVQPPQLSSILNRTASSSDQDKKRYREHNLRRLQSGFEGFEIFSEVPQVDDALYFGFENDLSRHVLGFELDCDPAGGAGIDPSFPPLIWEASSGEEAAHWRACRLESDSTRGMNGPGKVQVHVPDMGKYKIGKEDLFWVRVRVKEISSAEKAIGMRPYRVSPRVRRVPLLTQDNDSKPRGITRHPRDTHNWLT